MPVRGRFILCQLSQKLRTIAICGNVNRLTALLHDIDGVILLSINACGAVLVSLFTSSSNLIRHEKIGHANLRLNNNQSAY